MFKNCVAVEILEGLKFDLKAVVYFLVFYKENETYFLLIKVLKLKIGEQII